MGSPAGNGFVARARRRKTWRRKTQCSKVPVADQAELHRIEQAEPLSRWSAARCGKRASGDHGRNEGPDRASQRRAHYCRTDRIRPAPADAEGAPTIRGASNCPFREDEPGGSGVPWRNARRYSTPNHDCACITSARLGSQSPVMSRKRSLCRVAHLRNDQPGAERRPQTKATMARFGWCTQNRR